MLPLLICLTATAPAFAPVPVPREPKGATATWDFIGMSLAKHSLTLKRNGKETVFKVAEDVKVTMNGQKGYSFTDLGDTLEGVTAKYCVTLEKGRVVSLDVTLKLPKGRKLWPPGMSPAQIQWREAAGAFRELEELKRQRKR
jgi:hypothetical protein